MLEVGKLHFKCPDTVSTMLQSRFGTKPLSKRSEQILKSLKTFRFGIDNYFKREWGERTKVLFAGGVG